MTNVSRRGDSEVPREYMMLKAPQVYNIYSVSRQVLLIFPSDFNQVLVGIDHF